MSAYHELGVKELVRFDADAPEGARLRVWDRVDGDSSSGSWVQTGRRASRSA
jgi:hypothetical protein